MVVNVGAIRITIDLKPGVYIMDNESATGKTYLYKLINAANASGEKVLALTYNEVMTYSNVVCDLLGREKYNFIMLDRYDLYASNDILNLVHTLGCPVLIDFKGRLPFNFSANWCELEFNEEEIRLYVDDF